VVKISFPKNGVSEYFLVSAERVALQYLELKRSWNKLWKHKLVLQHRPR